MDEIAWYWENSDSTTQAVAQEKKTNELGIYDMSGNVKEWCWDWYGMYTEKSLENPRGPETGLKRVLRGGSWGNDAQGCRSTYCFSGKPDFRSCYYSFRLARGI